LRGVASALTTPRCNIIVVANQRYGLKRCSGTFGSILDLNVGSLQ
jgi:hypothetical protein